MPRLFAAIDLDAASRQTLADATAAFLDHAPEWAPEKWVQPANLHVTLMFLGDVPQAAVTRATTALAVAAGSATGFDLELRGVQAIPSPRRASMLWATLLDPSGRCDALARAVGESLRGLGDAQAAKAFSSHVTLVRARRPKPVTCEALAAAESALAGTPRSMSVSRATLYESTLTRFGPVYRAVSVAPLKDA